MSWDVTLYHDEELKNEIEWVGNYTSNVIDMYVDAMGHSLRSIHGMQSAEVIDTLSAGVVNMLGDADKYIAMNPANGWGSYEGALAYLTKILDACKARPESYVRVD